MSLNEFHRNILEKLKYCWFQYTDSSGVNHSIKTEEVVSIRDDISSGASHRGQVRHDGQGSFEV